MFFRWCELAAFTPVLRTHPGSFPNLNWQVILSDYFRLRDGKMISSSYCTQFDSDRETLLFFSQMQVVFEKCCSTRERLAL
jgi:hypothetical protein